MRITIESTKSYPKNTTKVIVEVPYDDLVLEEVRELIDQLLRGYGYTWDSDNDDNTTETLKE